MHKRDLSPDESIKESPEKLLKTSSSPVIFFNYEESPTESDIETLDNISHCKSNEETAKQKLSDSYREKNKKSNCRIQMEQDNRKRKSEYILKMVKKKQLHQRPPDSLLDLIVQAITSAPEGYVTFSNIYNYIADTYPFYKEKSHWWKKCIQVTLKRNRESFIHIPAAKGNQNDIWTIHPLAAARFLKGQTKSDSRKESHEETILNQETTDHPQDEKCKAARNSTQHAIKKPTSEPTKKSLTQYGFSKSEFGFVKIERSILIDRLARAYKKTQTKNSQSINSTKPKEITNSNSEEEWRGWPNPNSRLEEKRKLIQNVIEETESRLTSSLEDDVMDHEEIVCSEPEVHKEQEPVVKVCTQTQNLISSLLKAVEVLDRKKQAQEQAEIEKTLEQVKDESGFIGFDHDRWSGPWRGWERVNTRRRDQMTAMVSRMAGTLDLATVLADCSQAVSVILQELERQEIDKKEESAKEKRTESGANEGNYLLEKIQNQSKDLMKCVTNRNSEPPFSYTVLTVLALVSSPESSLPVPDIHRIIEEQFPFYRANEGSWKESVELILQMNNAFVKACQGPCGRKSPDHGGCWRLDAKRAEEILGRALRRENKIQQKNLEYKRSKENKENNNCNRTSVLENEGINEKQNTKTKDKTINLNNVLKTDGYQRGIRRNSVIVSTFDLEKSTKQVESENMNETQLKQLELPKKKSVSFETNIVNHNDSCNISETSINISEFDSSSSSGSNSANQSVNSQSTITDNTEISSTVSEMINKLAVDVDMPEGSEPSLVLSEQNNSDESVVSISSEEETEIHLMQYADSDKTVETDRISVVTNPLRKTVTRPSITPGDERYQPEAAAKTVGNSRNVQFCQICGKSFSCSFVFDHHSCFHSPYNSFACYVCHVLFNNSNLFWDHMNSLHPGAANHHLASSLCDPDRNKRAAGEVIAENHYKCTACLAFFSSKHKLDAHIEHLHSNIFTFECNFCRPAKLFRNKEEFRHHLVTRHPNNCPFQYACHECRAKFNTEDKLNKHILLFHHVEDESLKSKSLPMDDLVFVCSSCEACFECKQSLLSHLCPYKA